MLGNASIAAPHDTMPGFPSQLLSLQKRGCAPVQCRHSSGLLTSALIWVSLMLRTTPGSARAHAGTDALVVSAPARPSCTAVPTAAQPDQQARILPAAGHGSVGLLLLSTAVHVGLCRDSRAAAPPEAGPRAPARTCSTKDSSREQSHRSLQNCNQY